MIKKFSEQTIKELDYYVYELIDPRNGQIFYIGKGKGNRVFAHANDELKSFNDEVERDEDDASSKIKQIRAIRQAGLEVIHIIVRHGMDEKTAFEVESALIDCLSNDLTNIVSGHDSSGKGIANAEQLEKRYNVKEYEEPDFDYVIIKIRQDVYEERGSYYETCRSAWKLGIDRASKYKYAICCLNGIVVGVYEIDKWQPDHKDNSGRIEFVGKEASKEIADIFMNKRLPSKYVKKGMASPAFYSK